MFGCEYYFLPRSEDCNCNISVRDDTVLLVQSAKQHNPCVHVSLGTKNFFFWFFFLAGLGHKDWLCEEYNWEEVSKVFEGALSWYFVLFCSPDEVS